MKIEEERSAGAVIFYEDANGREYLLLNYPAGHWDFPKGNIEKGEKPIETAKREIYEETGLKDIEFIPGFERRIEYYYRREGMTIHKTVIYYLARSKSKNVRISWEHKGYIWLPYHEAVRKATYRNSKELLRNAEEFLKKRGTGIERFLTY